MILTLAILGLASVSSGGITPGARASERLDDMKAVMRDFYPPGALKAGEEGRVAFKVSLYKDGSLRSCIVTRSSGYPRLDRATCDLIVATARFKPVREDGNGRRTTSQHDGIVRWELPDGYEKGPDPTPAALASMNLAETEVICKLRPRLNSFTVRTKLCLSPADWGRALDNAQTETVRLQSPAAGGGQGGD